MPDAFEKWELDFKKFDNALKSTRELARKTISNMATISLATVGFSSSIFSIPQISQNINFIWMERSWWSLLGVAVIGLSLYLVESRIQYAKTWKAFQPTEYPKAFNYSLKEKTYAHFLLIFTLIFPSNLWSNGIYRSQSKKYFNDRINGLVVGKLAWLENNIVHFVELLIILLFVFGFISLLLGLSINL